MDGLIAFLLLILVLVLAALYMRYNGGKLVVGRGVSPILESTIV